MATKQKKQTKVKNIDLGKPVETVPLEKGWERGTDGNAFKFAKFGDSITGEFVRVEEVTGKGKSNILHLKVDDKPFPVFSSMGIERLLQRNEIVAGDIIRLTFTNVVELAKGRKFKVFTLDYKRIGKKGKK